jgi:predicted RNA-binding Zn ribbon-like protein
LITGVKSFISDDGTESSVTGQDPFDGYEDVSATIAVDLVNAVALDHAYGRPVSPADPLAAIRQVLAVDPPTAAMLRPADVPALVALARRLRGVFDALHRDDVDAAAQELNDLLAAHPAHPHLAKDDGVWRLHHHPADAALVPMVTAICAEGLARVVGFGAASRLGTCDADDCDRVFLDASKNSSRRFCTTTCQNRVKAAAFRRRRAATEPRG